MDLADVHSQSSSVIRMYVVDGVPFLAFQLFAISGLKSNVAFRSSSNSSTLSSMMLKLSKADLLVGVKMKSFIVFSTSVRPDSAQVEEGYVIVGSFMRQFITPYVSLEPCHELFLSRTLAQWGNE